MMRYSRRLCVLLFVATLSAALWAQPKVRREVDFGVKGGAAMSKYALYPKITQDQSVGATAGVAVRYIEEKYFGLQAEVLYTRRGMNDRYEDFPELQYEHYFHYLEVPVLAHIYFPMGKRNEIAVDLGPKVGYLIADKEVSNLDGNADFENLKHKASHGYAHHGLAPDRKFDYGIVARLGYEFRFGNKTSLQLHGGYYYGLGNLYKDTKADIFELSNVGVVEIGATFWIHHFVKIKKTN